MLRRSLQVLAAFTIGSCLLWAALGLLFRFSLYGLLPVAPGEPYGEADVLELFHRAVLLGLCGLALLEGLVLLAFGRLRLRPLAAFLCAFGVGLYLAYGPLHTWVAALALR